MLKHKWHKEIKAWADGEAIEFKSPYYHNWTAPNTQPSWCTEIGYQYRVKPKEYVLYGAVCSTPTSCSTYKTREELESRWAGPNFVKFTFDSEDGNLVKVELELVKERQT